MFSGLALSDCIKRCFITYMEREMTQHTVAREYPLRLTARIVYSTRARFFCEVPSGCTLLALESHVLPELQALVIGAVCNRPVEQHHVGRRLN